MYEVNGGVFGIRIPRMCGERFMRNWNALVENLSPTFSVPFTKQIAFAVSIGFNAVVAKFAKVSASMALVPLPGFRIVAAALIAGGSALVLSMFLTRVFY